MRAIIAMMAAFALMGCAGTSSDEEHKGAAIAACINTDSDGAVLDGYVVNAVGDKTAVERLLGQLKRGIGENVQGTPAGWWPATAHEKNADPLPAPKSCGPPQNSN
jgi:hypothetical protein